MAETIFSGVANSEIFKLAQKYSPAFKSLTANVTAQNLDAGWEANRTLDPTIVNEWFKLSMKMVLQKISVSEAKNPLENYGIVENYEDEFGNMAQRIAIGTMKPVEPKFHGLQDGQSVDHYIVRKPSLTERFFTQNFDFQNFFTLQDFQIKQILSSAYGMDNITAGIVAQMENSYTKQRYVNELEALSAGINSSNFPLKETQIVNLDSWTDGAVTDAELLDFIDTVNDVVSGMTLVPSTGAYNAGSFDSAVNENDLVLLVRPEIKNAIKTHLMAGAFNKEDLTLPIDVKPVINFGGLIPYVLDASKNKVYVQPIYNSLGEQVAYVDASVTVNGYATFVNGKWVVNVTSGGTTADTNQTVTDVEWEDVNENVLGIIIQKGAIFTTQQNGVQMIPTPVNARGIYTNYFFNVVNAGVHFDYFYNVVIIGKPVSDDSESDKT